ncbi:MAG: hypothetical protein ABIS20_14810 [Thermoanaerobaculia bacterium]
MSPQSSGDKSGFEAVTTFAGLSDGFVQLSASLTDLFDEKHRAIIGELTSNL